MPKPPEPTPVAMRRFATLFEELDGTTRTRAKIDAMAAYFRAVPPEDGAWAVFFLTGRRLKRLISGRTLRAFALERTGLPPWLMADAHAAVGDSAETVALLLDRPADGPPSEDLPLHCWVEERIVPLYGADAEARRRAVLNWWDGLERREIFLLNKLLTGAFRVGVSDRLVVRALAEVAALPPTVVSHRLMGHWQPSAAFFRALVAAEDGTTPPSRPYPFFLASPLEVPIEALGRRQDWLAEWKWDGVRAQLIRRGGECFIWSRGEELIAGRCPELVHAAMELADGCVFDGEILAWNEAGVMPFAALQTRIGRDRLTERALRAAPLAFLAYDLLEQDGIDLRAQPLEDRRRRLHGLLQRCDARLRVSPELRGESWDELARLREACREQRVEGLMLKRRGSPYRTGRRRGDWWKWKIAPHTVDAVLIYAQIGSGRRANLFTDYTFALWQGDELVPIAKAYSGLDDREILALDRWIRAHTRDRFGPVRAVEPVQVFELAFEGVNPSGRHKSGVALRFPRILRWRHDKPAAEADRLEHVQALIATPTSER